jgi:FAD/FMN-containing dehydrogenase
MHGSIRVMALAMLALSSVFTTALAAQPSPSDASAWTVTALTGGSFYSIATRANTGFLAGGAVGLRTTPHLSLEAGVRWHRCVDCTRFVTVDAGVRLHRDVRVVAPFLALGGGIASAPEFFGTEFAPWIASGLSIRWQERWAVQVEARGRRIRSGSGMGEVTLGLARRL